MKNYEVKLVFLPKKVLHKISKDVELPLNNEDQELAEKMIYHIEESRKPNSKFRAGVGVAAVQYGILKNMFYISVNKEDGVDEDFSDVLINPKVVATSAYEVALDGGEGCLSVDEDWPNQEGYVYRKNRIVIDAYSYKEKKNKRYDFNGYLAIIAQHELDHLQGKLFVDRINRKDPWEKKNDAVII